MNPPASVEGDDRVRLFCALTLPDGVLNALAEWHARPPRGDVRLVPRENLHVTLAFLGGRPRAELPAIGGELDAAAAAAGPIVLRPHRYRETRSVGMVVFDDEGGAAAALAGDLHERLQRLGVYEPERRPWLPHLTVARWREWPGLRPAPPPDRTFVPSDAAAYVSRLHPDGARYEVLESVALGG